MSSIISHKQNGMYVTCYRGINSVLLAMNLDKDKLPNLAGFSIHCVAPNKGPFPTAEYCLPNFLNFEHSFESDNKLNCENRRGSDKRPFQTFHWIHFPSAQGGKYQYTIYAAYFQQGKIIHPEPGLTFTINIDAALSFMNFELGFTRGYVSSQAYADKFHNEPLYPVPKTLDYDTNPYLARYEWLGDRARELIFEILDECEKDESTELDVFAFELSEPDIVRRLIKIGPRLRLFLDDSAGNNKPTSLERKVSPRLEIAGASIKRGHFGRLAHDKVMIKKRNKKPEKVLTGSANFSLRGLYVQPNSVLVFNDQITADLYEQAFQKAFEDKGPFGSSPIASTWHKVESANNKIPKITISFAPHRTPKNVIPFPLQTISDVIEKAKTSVFFAVMSPQGGGPVMSTLKNLASRKKLFSLGILDKAGSLDLFKGGVNAGTTAYAYLYKNVPAPFKRELNSLDKATKENLFTGVVVHHKFVVCDFNDKSPVVYCGSSNLAEGGEKQNGDNLLEIRDREVAVAYAVEAIRLYDHYRFRSVQSGTKKPLERVTLKETDEWVKPYYDKTNIKFRERELLSPRSKIS